MLKGAVLLELARRLGGRDAAFELLGMHEQMRNRNHHRIFRREIDRLRALADDLGEAVPEP